MEIKAVQQQDRRQIQCYNYNKMGHKAYQCKKPKRQQQNTWTPVPQGPPRNNRSNNKPINIIRVRDDHNPPKEVQQGLQKAKKLSQAAIQEQQTPTTGPTVTQ
ncbi:hypothetical protein DL764_008292 [Monosporascus ibericus]|uniref:CCHC-type domain-containing protein n=1 Tax=Monosporascus ibericus TaxID=155417 RepID=A0A4Q4SXX6_9PEZI|nr:hypothetical protein DL764_008292 [Monosporascus ibericus]